MIGKTDRAGSIDIGERQVFCLTRCRNAQAIIRNGDIVAERLLGERERCRDGLRSVERIVIGNGNGRTSGRVGRVSCAGEG